MVKETYEEIYKEEFLEDESEGEEIELEMIFDFFIHDDDVQFSPVFSRCEFCKWRCCLLVQVLLHHRKTRSID